MIVSDLEFAGHVAVTIISMATIVFMVYSISKYRRGDLQRIFLLYALAFIFSAFRWMGGSLARLDAPAVDNPAFLAVWTLSGILAGIFGIWASIKLIYYRQQVR